MDISTLNAFIAVARYQSFSKASEHLFVTQPAISKRVAALEEELGTKLFNRIARQISLTDAGKQLLPRAQDLVNQADDMQRYASNLNDDVGGILSIAVSHHIGLHRLPPVLKEFNLRYPKVELDIRFEDSDQAFREVEQGDIEYAVITLPSNLSEKLVKQVVWVDKLDVVVGLEHELAHIKAADLKTLSQYAAVLPSKGTETHQVIQRQFERAGHVMQVQMETNNLETLKMLVGAGLGWSLLPKGMADSSLKTLNLGIKLQRELGLVLHSKRSLSNAAKALMALIEESSSGAED
ncbi:MAG: DNA-binding transcriptional LysR family regulator [Cryomorphaceae bacterium]|jgi:DNA-binding transcriptional LysR family regulator